jgi:SAM-dependent methyltransferase
VTGPTCSCCYDDAFDRKHAEDKLRSYRRDGPGRTSVALADALAKGGLDGRSVLDIGAGVGAVHHLLLERGAASAVDVDASRPYLDAARSEAARRGLADRVRFEHGDFVSVAALVEPADLVALDRVACCYTDVDALVRSAAAHTRRRLGIVIPPDGRFARFIIGLLNGWEVVRRSPFRMYAHPHARVIAAARAGGLTPAGTANVGIWRMLLFEREVLTAGTR